MKMTEETKQKMNNIIPLPHKYKLKYNVVMEHNNAKGYKKEELGDLGGTDALLWCSFLYPNDGSFSVKWFSRDGRQKFEKPLKDKEIFKAWALLASQLNDSEELHEWQKFIVNEAWKKFCQIINSH